MVICDETGTPCQHGNDCLLRGACRLIPNNGLGNLIASQPYSTNQAPEAPSLEQLAKDAARYRWLREDCPWTIMCEVFNADVEAEKSYEQNKLTLDDAIDAAMAERNKETA